MLMIITVYYKLVGLSRCDFVYMILSDIFPWASSFINEKRIPFEFEHC